MAFSSEAIPPVELGIPSHRVHNFSADVNKSALKEYLDLLEEEREMAEERILWEKVKAEQYFNKRVRPRAFRVGDLVLKRSGVAGPNEGKMGPRWEGPYLIIANN